MIPANKPPRESISGLEKRLDGMGAELQEIQLRRPGEKERLDGVYRFFDAVLAGDEGRSLNQTALKALNVMRQIRMNLTDLEAEENPGLNPPSDLFVPLKMVPPVVNLQDGREVMLAFQASKADLPDFYTNVTSSGRVFKNYGSLSPSGKAQDDETIRAIASFPDITEDSLNRALDLALAGVEEDISKRMGVLRGLRGGKK